MRSAGTWRSMVLALIGGSQRSKPLKSRRMAHTRSTGASMIVLLTTRTIGSPSASELPLQGIEAALEHAVADVADQIGLPFRCAVELRRPFQEGALAVCDGGQPQGRNIVLDPHRRFKDRVGAEHVEVRQPQQLLADTIAVAHAKLP